MSEKVVTILSAKEAAAIAHKRWIENRIVELNNAATNGDVETTFYVTASHPVNKLVEAIGAERVFIDMRTEAGDGAIKFAIPVGA